MTIKIPTAVADKLGYYVYLYIDPRNGRPFYVGKGRGGRALTHISDKVESKKKKVISELMRRGREPRIDILAHSLRDEETAFRIEAAVIDLLGLDKLTNKVHGWNAIDYGRMPLSELIFFYMAKPVTISHPAILIRINKLYRHDMSGIELYDATRGVWKLGTRRNKAMYAFAVFHGVVREVYTIKSWHEAGTTIYKSRDRSTYDPSMNNNIPGRWEFKGIVSPDIIRKRYVGRSVESYFKKGAQSPVLYVNAD